MIDPIQFPGAAGAPPPEVVTPTVDERFGTMQIAVMVTLVLTVPKCRMVEDPTDLAGNGFVPDDESRARVDAAVQALNGLAGKDVTVQGPPPSNPQETQVTVHGTHKGIRVAGLNFQAELFRPDVLAKEVKP